MATSSSCWYMSLGWLFGLEVLGWLFGLEPPSNKVPFRLFSFYEDWCPSLPCRGIKCFDPLESVEVNNGLPSFMHMWCQNWYDPSSAIYYALRGTTFDTTREANAALHGFGGERRLLAEGVFDNGKLPGSKPQEHAQSALQLSQAIHCMHEDPGDDVRRR